MKSFEAVTKYYGKLRVILQGFPYWVVEVGLRSGVYEVQHTSGQSLRPGSQLHGLLGPPVCHAWQHSWSFPPLFQTGS